MSVSSALLRLGKGAITLTAAALLSGMAVAAQKSPPKAGSEYPRRFGYITMKDRVRLAYVAYLPRAKGKFPAVLKYEPYLGAGSAPDWQSVSSSEGMWIRNGYAIVFASVRGTGCSQGVLDPFGPHEGPDGAAIIDWIGAQPWSDRRVGMIGVSYPGFTQILVAAQHPKLLEAITPSAVAANTYSEAVYPGGIPNVGFGAEWSLHVQPWFEAMGVKTRVGWGDPECESNYRAHPPPRGFIDARAHPLFDQWWQVRSLGKYIDQVHVPTFMSGTWQDHAIMASGTTELYERLRGPKRLSMAPGGHTRIYAQPALQQDLLQWMNRWVKGVRNGSEAEAPVTIYWETKGDPPVASWTTHYATWPPKSTAMQTFWLTSAGTLSATAPASAPADAAGLEYTFPTGVELVGDNTQFALPPNPYGSLTWTSAPFDRDFTILGRVQVKFYAASQNVDTDFEVTLHDVYPNGAIQYLQRGFLRASLRAVDRGESTPDHIGHTYGRNEYLVPGRIYEMQLSLPPLGAVLRKGHRLQLVILAPSPIPQPDWGLLPVSLPGQNTIYASAKYPSDIIVPTIPGATAEGPEPACGSLAFQPCRAAPVRQ
ncbi:MAG TPA: CocE/NonD family hydrolase [Steroidobacteraceae bacterium]|nr:CocE/NonD family hydrolase [Steroidobacteraceae bacterium]